MTLSAQILLSLLLGVAAGLFFGELAAPIKVVGDAFVLLLQMAVLPFVVVSLISGLGTIDAKDAARMAFRAGAALLVLWGAAITGVLILPLAFPDWESASFFSSSLVEETARFDFLKLFIPANPFHSFSEAIVPAIVVFSVAVGIALIRIEKKEHLIAMLETLREALSAITTFVVKLAPIGIFSIACHAAGTLPLDQATSLQVYMAAYATTTVVLALWTIPGLVAAVTDHSYRKILRFTREALVTAFATGSVFVVLSLLATRSKDLLAESSPDDEDGGRIIDIVIPVAYTFPSAGTLSSLGFVLFAGWLTGYELPASQLPSFLVTGVSSLFGATVIAIPFLLDMFQIPSDTFGLFLVADNVVGARFGAMLAAMHFVSIALVTAAAIAGKLKFRPAKLLRYAVVTLLLTTLPIAAIRLGFESLGRKYEGYDLFVSMQPLFEPVRSRVLETPGPSEDVSRPTLERIRERGVLRVGFLPNRLPWSFRNSDGQLVGFDTEMAHVLARDLDVDLEFVEVSADEMPRGLEGGAIDVGMSGIPITTALLESVNFSPPYIDETIAFIVRDYQREQYSSREAIQQISEPTIAVLDIPYYIDKVKRYLPTAKLVLIETPREFFRAPEGAFDALLFTAESGSAWSLIYPSYTVAVPRPDILKVPLAYAVRRGDDEMADFLASWIELKRRDASFDRLFNHWILGRVTAGRAPRWSILRDVLGWVD